MSKENVRQLTGVVSSIFSHTGYISKDEAKEISGMDEHEFEKTYAKAGVMSQKIIHSKGNKVDAFISQIAREINEYTAHYGGKLFK